MTKKKQNEKYRTRTKQRLQECFQLRLEYVRCKTNEIAGWNYHTHISCVRSIFMPVETTLTVLRSSYYHEKMGFYKFLIVFPLRTSQQHFCEMKSEIFHKNISESRKKKSWKNHKIIYEYSKCRFRFMLVTCYDLFFTFLLLLNAKLLSFTQLRFKFYWHNE